MRSTIENFLESLWNPGDGVCIQLGDDRDQFLQHWGFTIYRTFYGPGSDEQWVRLLEHAIAGAEIYLTDMEGADKDPARMTRLWGLFKLDIRSDPATLDGLTLEEVRQLYLDGTGGQPMNVDSSPYRIFILADAEVLADPAPDPWALKVAAADYDAVAAVPRNWRVGPQRYFGWMRMPATAILDLWIELQYYFLNEIIERIPGGPGQFWVPDYD